MTRRECHRAVAREFDGVRNLGANLIDNAQLDAYGEIHSAVLVPQTLTLDGESYTWQGGATEDPSASLTRWRGRPAAIMASSDEWVQVRADELVWRKSRIDNDANQAYAQNERGILGLAYAIGTGNEIALAGTLAAGTVLTIWHYQTPTPLTSADAVVQLPDGFTDVLTLKTIWYVTRFLANRSVPGFGIQQVRDARERADERFEALRTWLNSDENIPHIRTGGQMVRLTKSLTDEFLRAVD